MMIELIGAAIACEAMIASLADISRTNLTKSDLIRVGVFIHFIGVINEEFINGVASSDGDVVDCHDCDLEVEEGVDNP